MEKERLELKADKIALEVTKHTGSIDKIVVDVADLKEKTSKIIDGQDKMMVILQRLDQERIFTIERVRHLEEEVNKIKVHLAL
ncbi:MAG: hypothetical protein U9Q24_03295 [Candidatus Ratteibacteria bacterium]|nr:hypothetical protein [Candidatus Ratteibacteria bacterium]